MEELALNEYYLPSVKLNDGYTDKHGKINNRNNTIKKLKIKGESMKNLCEMFGLSRRQVGRICNESN